MEQLQKQLHWFIDPIKNHYVDFEGRVTRQTYWMFFLWYFIIYVVLSLVGGFAATLFSWATLIPSLGLGARRLHDIGKSGWWQLIGIIPILGWVIIIYLLAQQGGAGPNSYGADPRGVSDPVPAPPPQSTAPAAVSETVAGQPPRSEEPNPSRE